MSAHLFYSEGRKSGLDRTDAEAAKPVAALMQLALQGVGYDIFAAQDAFEALKAISRAIIAGEYQIDEAMDAAADMERIATSIQQRCSNLRDQLSNL